MTNVRGLRLPGHWSLVSVHACCSRTQRTVRRRCLSTPHVIVMVTCSRIRLGIISFVFISIHSCLSISSSSCCLIITVLFHLLTFGSVWSVDLLFACVHVCCSWHRGRHLTCAPVLRLVLAWIQTQRLSIAMVLWSCCCHSMPLADLGRWVDSWDSVHNVF